MLGLGVLALASCTNEEVVSVPEGSAISFNTFVNNATKAVAEVTNTSLDAFYVFGAYNSDQSSWTNVYTNVEVEGGEVGDDSQWTPKQEAYWQPDKTYHFAGYSNGNSNTNATFEAATGALTFTNYNVLTEQKDLIAAINNSVTTDGNITNENDVDMTFAHMLSQVKFTFTTKASTDYTLKISDIEIASAVTTATGNYTTTGTTWTGNADGTYKFTDLADIAVATGEGYAAATQTDLFVIPQENTDLKVTFHASMSDASGVEILVGDFEGALAYSNTASSATDNEWTEGYRYNYQVEINGEDMHEPDDPDAKGQVIKFNVESTGDWTDADNQTITPDAVQGN